VPNSAGIHDVARAAGVSASTVSNVLNGRDHRMRSDTKRRVLAAIEELGYMPNASARQLKTGQNKTIGLIVPSVANPFWGLLAHEVERAAMGFGYKVLFCNAERDAEAERLYAEMLWSSGVRGVILSSSPLSFEHLGGLARRGMVVAGFDQQTGGPGEVLACSVSVDNVVGGRAAIGHLIELGHRRIGIVSGAIRTRSRVGRLAGYHAALDRAGIARDPALVWEGPSVSGFGDTEGAQLGRAGARHLLGLPDPPTAIFGINDMYALGAYAGVRDLGLSVPEDVSVVGFDDISLAEMVQPTLTSVRQPLGAMARSAVAALIARLQGEAVEEPAHVTVVPQLVVRASTAPPRRTDGRPHGLKETAR